MPRNCPKCQFEMKEGVIGERGISRWHDIAQERITADMRDRRDFEYTDRRTGVAINAWKCGNCGYVEFFSPV